MRRTLLLVGVGLAGVAVGVLGAAYVAAQGAAQVTRTELLRKPVSGVEGKEFVVFVADLPPGAVAGRHFHPGDEAIYMLQGAERLPDLASELARLSVDVIVTSGEPAALAAKRATSTIPIVATDLAWDPVKAGLVASLARPGGNVTGIATRSEELWQKRLALLKQAVPRMSRCQVWFKYGDEYFIADSDSDRRAKVLRRTVKP